MVLAVVAGIVGAAWLAYKAAESQLGTAPEAPPELHRNLAGQPDDTFSLFVWLDETPGSIHVLPGYENTAEITEEAQRMFVGAHALLAHIDDRAHNASRLGLNAKQVLYRDVGGPIGAYTALPVLFDQERGEAIKWSLDEDASVMGISTLRRRHGNTAWKPSMVDVRYNRVYALAAVVHPGKARELEFVANEYGRVVFSMGATEPLLRNDTVRDTLLQKNPDLHVIEFLELIRGNTMQTMMLEAAAAVPGRGAETLFTTEPPPPLPNLAGLWRSVVQAINWTMARRTWDKRWRDIKPDNIMFNTTDQRWVGIDTCCGDLYNHVTMPPMGTGSKFSIRYDMYMHYWHAAIMVVAGLNLVPYKMWRMYPVLALGFMEELAQDVAVPQEYRTQLACAARSFRTQPTVHPKMRTATKDDLPTVRALIRHTRHHWRSHRTLLVHALMASTTVLGGDCIMLAPACSSHANMATKPAGTVLERCGRDANGNTPPPLESLSFSL
jgi:hypothetical protein